MPNGFARGSRGPKPLTRRGMNGVYLSDMPSEKPFIPRRRRIKGLPGLDVDPDYAPGGGTWVPVERRSK